MADIIGTPNNDLFFFVPGDNYNGLGGTDSLAFGAISFPETTVTKTGPLNGTVATPAGDATFVDVENLLFLDGRLTFDIGDEFAQTWRMYNAAFDRAPDPFGFERWGSQLRQDEDFDTLDLAETFLNSAEGQARFAALSNEAFVTTLYQTVLDRTPSDTEVQSWVVPMNVGAGISRAEVLRGFSESAEHVNLTAATVQAGLWDVNENVVRVSQAYETGLGRVAEKPGAIAWTEFLNEEDRGVRDLTDAIFNSAEFQGRHAAQSNEQYIAQLYTDGLGRTGSDPEIQSWLTAVASGASRADIFFGFVDSVEGQQRAFTAASDGILFA